MTESDLRRVESDLLAVKRALGLGSPALGLAHVRGFLWMAFTGLLLIAAGLLHGSLAGDIGGWLVLACWVALPVRGLVGRLLGRPEPDFTRAENALPRYYSLTVLGFGTVLFAWTRLLDLPWPLTLGMLFFIEALPLLMVSLSDRRCRAGIGLALGLITCGLGVPFVQGPELGALLGGAIFVGCSASAGILYCQTRRDCLAGGEGV